MRFPQRSILAVCAVGLLAHAAPCVAGARQGEKPGPGTDPSPAAAAPGSSKEKPAAPQVRPGRNLAGSVTTRLPKDETDPVHLLLSQPVLDDLKVTDAQCRTIDALMREQARASWPFMQGLRDAHDPEGRARAEALLMQAHEEFSRRVFAELTPRQYRRLIQIAARNAGIRALRIPAIVEQMNMLPDERAAVEAVLDEMDRREAAMRAASRAAYQARRERIAPDDIKALAALSASQGRRAEIEKLDRELKANRERARRALLRILTRGQLERFERLIGPPVEEEPQPENGGSRPR